MLGTEGDGLSAAHHRRRRPDRPDPDGGRGGLAQRRCGRGRGDVGSAGLTAPLRHQAGVTPGAASAGADPAPVGPRGGGRLRGEARLHEEERRHHAEKEDRRGQQDGLGHRRGEPGRDLGRQTRPTGAAGRGAGAGPGRRSEVGDQPRLDDGGDRGAAEHGTDLSGRVVDPGARTGRPHGEVAGRRGGERRPHAGVGHAEQGHRQQQLPERRRFGVMSRLTQNREIEQSSMPLAVM